MYEDIFIIFVSFLVGLCIGNLFSKCKHDKEHDVFKKSFDLVLLQDRLLNEYTALESARKTLIGFAKDYNITMEFGDMYLSMDARKADECKKSDQS